MTNSSTTPASLPGTLKLGKCPLSSLTSFTSTPSPFILSTSSSCTYKGTARSSVQYTYALSMSTYAFRLGAYRAHALGPGLSIASQRACCSSGRSL